jgi:hypothetical protein
MSAQVCGDACGHGSTAVNAKGTALGEVILNVNDE